MTTELVGQPEGLRYTLQQLLRAMVEKGASDMHITSGPPPLLRIDGTVVPLKLPPLMPADSQRRSLSGTRGVRTSSVTGEIS